jgi:hypothetical protein
MRQGYLIMTIYTPEMTLPHYFLLSSPQLEVLDSLPLSSKLYFILQLGYFMARRQFFMFHFSRVKNDIAFIMQMYGYGESSLLKIPSRNIQSKIKNKY